MSNVPDWNCVGVSLCKSLIRLNKKWNNPKHQWINQPINIYLFVFFLQKGELNLIKLDYENNIKLMTTIELALAMVTCKPIKNISYWTNLQNIILLKIVNE